MRRKLPKPTLLPTIRENSRGEKYIDAHSYSTATFIQIQGSLLIEQIDSAKTYVKGQRAYKPSRDVEVEEVLGCFPRVSDILSNNQVEQYVIKDTEHNSRGQVIEALSSLTGKAKSTTERYLQKMKKPKLSQK